MVSIPEGHLAGHQAEELSEGTFFDWKALVWSPVKVEDYEDECGFSERIWVLPVSQPIESSCL